MRTICLYFQVHQPFRFKRYRFFDIGNDHYYYDDYTNESITRRVADKCYLPANRILLDLVERYPGKFRLAFSLSGIAFDQLELYAPEVLESFRELAGTGSVEFLAETNAHSLASLTDMEEFKKQVGEQVGKVRRYFGQEPRVFRNTELIYSDEIGAAVAEMGYEAMLTEGARHILGWKSPNYLYCNAVNPKLKILLKNFKLSDDIAFRFSDRGWDEYPLTAGKFASWLNRLDKKEETVNLFMDYETFGEHQWEETGIFEFLKALPGAVFRHTGLSFATPSEIARELQPVSAVQVPYPISWADEERDVTAWLGNEMQQEAFNKLYDLKEKVKKAGNPDLLKDWNYLQESDHFYYMSTKFFSDGAVHSYFNPYQSPYDAFINYMNILSDFVFRLNALVPETDKEIELSHLQGVIEKKDKQLQKYREEIDYLSEIIAGTRKKPGGKKSAAGKDPPRKPEVTAKRGRTSAGKSGKSTGPAKKSAAGNIIPGKLTGPTEKTTAKKSVPGKSPASAKKTGTKKTRTDKTTTKKAAGK